jgi:hypothetical protein
MTNNTKARTEQIFNTAASVLEAAGGCVWFDDLMTTPAARWQELQKMYAAVIAATGCHRDTAKRHVAKALRRARYGEMVKHGGTRPGAGAPPGNRNAARKTKPPE